MLHRLLTIIVASFLTACGPIKVDGVPTPIPSPLPDCTSFAPRDYNSLCQKEVVSPDQQHRWSEECLNLGMELRCQILFPNGQKSAEHDWSLKWSPTNTHTLVPIGGNHDTPPAGYELWNMLTGTRTAVLEPAGSPWRNMLEWIEWAPDGLSVFYLKYGSSDRTSIVLVQIDAATGAERVMRQCPDWLLATLWNADAYRHWSPYCDNVRMPPDVPAILSFMVEPKTINAGESITLRWTSQGGTVATLRHNVSGTLSDEASVPVSGTLSMRTPNMRIEEGFHPQFDFVLRVTNDRGQSDELTVQVRIE